VTIDKAKIDDLIPKAYEALQAVRIAQNGKLDSGYRGQIAAFGAAVSMGSVLSAIAFFSEQGSSEYGRDKLMKAIAQIIDGCRGTLYDYAAEKKDAAKREILHAAIALKLAMNLYEWEKKGKEGA